MAERSICFFKINYLGDAVTFLPTVAGARAAFPGANIVVVCSTATADLYTGTFPGIRVVPVPRQSANGMRALGQIPRLWATLGFQTFDAALLSNDEPSLSLLAARFAARRRIGFDQAPERLHWCLSDILPATAGRNIVDINFDLVRRLAGDGALTPARTPIGFNEDDRDLVAKKLSELGIGRDVPFVLLHPFGKKRYQMWGNDKYRALADRLRDFGIDCAFLSGGPAERMEGAKVVAGLTVNQLAALCRTARLFVGSNSGPMHIAAAMGTPSLVIQGPTSAEWNIFWRDVPHKHLAALHVPCVPCERLGKVVLDCTNYASPMACMAAISVDDAYAEAVSLLTASRESRA